MEKEITMEQAVALADACFWVTMDLKDIAMFQLFTPRLCMPFAVFRYAMDKTLGRGIFTHEYGEKGAEQLQKEILGGKPVPSFEEILNLIPKEIRLSVFGGEYESTH